MTEYQVKEKHAKSKRLHPRRRLGEMAHHPEQIGLDTQTAERVGKDPPDTALLLQDHYRYET